MGGGQQRSASMRRYARTVARPSGSTVRLVGPMQLLPPQRSTSMRVLFVLGALVCLPPWAVAQEPCVEMDAAGLPAEIHLHPHQEVTSDPDAYAEVDAVFERTARRAWASLPCTIDPVVLAESLAVLDAERVRLPEYVHAEYVSSLMNAVRASPVDPAVLSLHLLGDHGRAGLAMDVLHYAPDSTREEGDVREALVRLIEAPGTEIGVRLRALAEASEAAWWPRVDAAARALADTLRAQPDRRAAATYVAYALAARGQLLEAYRDEAERPGALRLRLAEFLFWDDDIPYGAPGIGHARDVLIAAAKGEALPPSVRGSALSALGRRSEDVAVRDALVALLEPEHWFFGGSGHHGLVHSTALLVDVLADPARRGDRVARVALERLADRLDEIGEGGAFTEGNLNRILDR